MIQAIGDAFHPRIRAAEADTGPALKSTTTPQEEGLSESDRISALFPLGTINNPYDDLFLVLVADVDRESRVANGAMAKRLPRSARDPIQLIGPARGGLVQIECIREIDTRAITHWCSPAQRTAVQLRPHQQTESCQVATTEPVVVQPRASGRRFQITTRCGRLLQRLVGRRVTTPAGLRIS